MLGVHAISVLRQTRYRNAAPCQSEKALRIVFLRNLNVSYRKHQTQNRQIILTCQVTDFATTFLEFDDPDANSLTGLMLLAESLRLLVATERDESDLL